MKLWTEFADICFYNLLNRKTRHISVLSLSRLFWVYLFRSSETLAKASETKIDSFIRRTFSGGKAFLVPYGLDSSTLDLFTFIIWQVCIKHLDFACSEIFYYLLDGGSLFGISPTAGALYQTYAVVPYQTFVGVIGPPVVMPDNMASQKSIGSLEKSVSYGSGIHSNSNYPDFPDEPMPVNNNSSAVSDVLYNPERLNVVFRAFILLLADVELVFLKKEPEMSKESSLANLAGKGPVLVESKFHIPPPPFPKFSYRYSSFSDNFSPTFESLQNYYNDRVKSIPSTSSSISARKIILNDLFPLWIHNKMGKGIRDVLETLNEVLGRSILALDAVIGYSLIMDLSGFQQTSQSGSPPATRVEGYGSIGGGFDSMGKKFTAAAPNQQQRSSQTGSVNSDHKSEKAEISEKHDVKVKQIRCDLLRTSMDCIPRLTPYSLSCINLAEILSKLCFHSNFGVRTSAASCLRRITLMKKSDIIAAYSNQEPRVYWDFGDNSMLRIFNIYNDVFTSTADELYLTILQSLIMDDDLGFNAYYFAITVYVELVDIWFESLTDLESFVSSEAADILREIESRGLFFICHFKPEIRRQGILLFKIIEKFEEKWRMQNSRKIMLNRQSNHSQGRYRSSFISLITEKTPNDRNGSTILSIFEDHGVDLMKRHFRDPNQSKSDSSMSPLDQRSLIDICSSNSPSDIGVWNRCFVEIVSLFFEFGRSKTIQLAIGLVLSKLKTLYPSIANHAELIIKTETKSKPSKFIIISDSVLEQWKNFLNITIACIEIQDANKIRYSDPTLSLTSSKGLDLRFLEQIPFFKSPDPALLVASDTPIKSLLNSRDLFHILIPLLACDKPAVRASIVSSFGCLHWLSYKVFFEDLIPYLSAINEDIQLRLNSNIVAPSNYRTRLARLCIDVSSILALVADFVDHYIYRKNNLIMVPVMEFIHSIYTLI